MIILISILAFAFTFTGGLFALKFRDKLHLILGFSAGAVIGGIAKGKRGAGIGALKTLAMGPPADALMRVLPRPTGRARYVVEHAPAKLASAATSRTDARMCAREFSRSSCPTADRGRAVRACASDRRSGHRAVRAGSSRR